MRFWLDRGRGRLPRRCRALDGQARGPARPVGGHARDRCCRSGGGMPDHRGHPLGPASSVHDIPPAVPPRSWTRTRVSGWPSARRGCPTRSRLAHYVRPDELNLTFNFELVEAGWGAASFRDRDRLARCTAHGRGRRAVHVGARPTTTSTAPPRATAAVSTGVARATRGRVGAARPCPARSTCTTATSWVCRTSTCPTTRCRTPPGNAAATPTAAATASGCRCRGAAHAVRCTASPPATPPGCPCPATGPPLTVETRRDADPSLDAGRCSAPPSPGCGANLDDLHRRRTSSGSTPPTGCMSASAAGCAHGAAQRRLHAGAPTGR